jgi:hypothetical protein
MATLGNVPAEAYTNTVKDSFSGNGSATAFTMSLPTVTNDVRVVVENVIQDPTVAYSVSGTTLTFTSAPPTGTNNIYVVHLGPAVMTTVPPAEIADATTFASSLTVQGAFTSKGIDDNADAVALTIDSSENVFVGKTSAGLSTAGVQLDATGSGGFCRAETCLTLSRLSTDGSILDFRKDSTTVGNIGVDQYDNYTVSSNRELIISTDRTVSRSYVLGDGGTSNGVFYPTTDNDADFGSSSKRWKDAYLSGGIYLGGAVAANKLDDYETGTWTPSYVSTDATDPTVSYSLRDGRYTKIGRTVIASFRLRGAITGTKVGSLRISGLPFTSASDNAGNGGSIRLTENFGTNAHPNSVSAGSNKTEIILTSYDSSDPRAGLFTAVNVSSTSTSSSGNYILGQVVYDI